MTAEFPKGSRRESISQETALERQDSIVPVTLSTLPPIEIYTQYLQQIWKTRHLTNFGPLATRLEKLICDYLGTQNCQYVVNGTVALQLAIKALELRGEVLTTAFSFVATSSSLFWENCRPRLVDIDPQTLNIDPKKIEASITPETTGVLATHVYGNPCDIDALEDLCRKHNLKLIFDAAHAFGINYRGRPLLTHGDISICSLHATKVFHSVEGGLIYFRDEGLTEKLKYMKNFGIKGPEEFEGVGINAKASEFHAAMGLALWPMLNESIEKRVKIQQIYDNVLQGTRIFRPTWNEEATKNGAYYPVILPSEKVVLRVQSALADKNVFTRRYFYPCLSELEYAKYDDVTIAQDLSRRVLCLPIYPDLQPELAEKIAKLVLKTVQTSDIEPNLS